MRGFLFAILSSCLVAGCCTRLPQTQVINAAYIYKVQAEVKRQIGVYQIYMHEIKSKSVPDPVAVDAEGYWCGSGNINFNVSTVKLDLLTTTDDTLGATVSVTIPILPTGSVGPSAGTSHEVNNTQEYVFNEWPLAYDDQKDEFKKLTVSKEVVKANPIANALVNLRNGLILADEKAPIDPATNQPLPVDSEKAHGCLRDFSLATPSADPGNSFKLGITVTDDNKGGVSVNLGVIGFGATAEGKSILGNTITVTFMQDGIPVGVKPCDNDDTGKTYCKADGKTKVSWTPTNNGVGIMTNPPDPSQQEAILKKIKEQQRQEEQMRNHKHRNTH